MWLDRNVSIDTNLIVWITRFPMEGEDSSLLFTNNSNEKKNLKRMK
jgi:hypothetical protein